MATSVSPGMGTQRHQWIAPKKRDGANATSMRRRLAELFPTMKFADIDVMSHIVTRQELAQYERDLGH